MNVNMRHKQIENGSSPVCPSMSCGMPWPDMLAPDKIKTMVMGRGNHKNDFEYGDLEDRIYAHGFYTLELLPLADVSMSEFAMSSEDVQDYMNKGKESPFPPLVWDGMQNSMIDGMHRANAALALGQTHAWAYVGRGGGIEIGEWDEE